MSCEPHNSPNGSWDPKRFGNLPQVAQLGSSRSWNLKTDLRESRSQTTYSILFLPPLESEPRPHSWWPPFHPVSIFIQFTSTQSWEPPVLCRTRRMDFQSLATGLSQDSAVCEPKENHLLNPRDRGKRVSRGQEGTNHLYNNPFLSFPLLPQIPSFFPSPALFRLTTLPSLCRSHPPPIRLIGKLADLQYLHQVRGKGQAQWFYACNAAT